MPKTKALIETLLGNPAQTAFLSSAAKPKIIAQTLIALANGSGGAVVMGLSKNGRPRKLPSPEDSQDQIMQAALQCDPPLIIPSPEAHRYKGHPLLIAVIPPDLPHVYNFQGQYLIWEGGQPAPLRGSVLRQFIFNRGEAGFEGMIFGDAARSALNWEAVQAYVSSVEGLRHLSLEEALLRRGCLKLDNGELRPTNVGLLLFASDPQRYFPQAEITVARYTGLQMSDAFVRADIRGTLPEQVRRAEAFVLENIGLDVRMDGLQRSEATLYPRSAVREVIVNALAHRDYSIRGDNIRLLLFANRLECYSPGRLPGHVTVDNIVRERFSRNAAMVQVLFDMGFIERLGYGIDRIIRSLAEQGLPAPELAETAAGFRVTLYSNPQNAHLQDRASLRRWLKMGLNERQIKALAFLADKGRITNADYQSLCPAVSQETLRRDLSDLVNRNLLLRIGEKRATFYILK
ncbi:MAG TPA: transcriptional regulator [Chloroflexi bacterium]|nr:transcriptional regulator [Chloroflexota bacterium]